MKVQITMFYNFLQSLQKLDKTTSGIIKETEVGQLIKELGLPHSASFSPKIFDR